jgi:DNA-binding response OmpR family regulator
MRGDAGAGGDDSAAFSDLAGAKALVVDDEYLIALDIASTLLAAGCRVLGPVASCEEGLGLLRRERPDLAILDVALRDGSCAALAESLRDRGVPFALVTGYARGELPDGLGAFAAAYLEKPFDDRGLLQVAARLRRAPTRPSG